MTRDKVERCTRQVQVDWPSHLHICRTANELVVG